ncbi:MAG: protein kinase domain-containing protein, partial [Chthoniobacterales bacterium]
MTPARLQKIDELFQVAVEKSPNERSAFLDETCAGDESLRREVEELLAADNGAEDFEKIGKGVAADWAATNDRRDFVGQTFGRYKILAPLAAGGMGEVFIAEDLTLKRKAAIKFLPRKFTRDDDRLRRFEKEARAASALNHPNIITIYEIGEWDGTHFIVSELIEGETLPARLPLAQVLDIGCQAAGALAAAHEAGIVHRDIKPANIMLRKDGYIKVLDFGLAKLTSTAAELDATEPGRVMGTVNYMSPEQALGKPLDHRTDIFSLGVVLYEIATGRRLFAGQSEAATYDCILNQEPPPMREIDPALPDEFELVVRRALEKDPERRYQSASDLRDDLKRLASGNEQTEAAKISLMRKRTARRSRNLRVAAAASIILILAAIVFFVGQRSANRSNEISRKSIAVLPFDNLSGNDDAALAEGVHEQLLTDLTKVADLKVISRTSVQSFKSGVARNRREIAQQLRVAYLLEGKVQRLGEQVRVNAQLIDGKTDAPVWSETYNDKVADVFAVQSAIAKKIVTQLRAKLSPAESAEIERKPTSDMGAFAFYTRGKTLTDLARTGENAEPNFRAGIDFLNEAVARDPNFFAAWCELASAHDTVSLFGFDATPARHDLAQAAVDAARRLSPDAGDTHLVAAMHLYAELDYDRAREELALARQSLPNDPRTFELSGYINRRQNRWEESTRDFERVAEVDPLNVDVLQTLASNYDALHRYEDWAAIFDRIIALRPERIGPRIARGVVDQWWRADTRRMHAEIEARIAQD